VTNDEHLIGQAFSTQNNNDEDGKRERLRHSQDS
jgi:hypothetical protein